MFSVNIIILSAKFGLKTISSISTRSLLWRLEMGCKRVCLLRLQFENASMFNELGQTSHSTMTSETSNCVLLNIQTLSDKKTAHLAKQLSHRRSSRRSLRRERTKFVNRQVKGRHMATLTQLSGPTSLGANLLNYTPVGQN